MSMYDPDSPMTEIYRAYFSAMKDLPREHHKAGRVYLGKDEWRKPYHRTGPGPEFKGKF